MPRCPRRKSLTRRRSVHQLQPVQAEEVEVEPMLLDQGVHDLDYNQVLIPNIQENVMVGEMEIDNDDTLPNIPVPPEHVNAQHQNVLDDHQDNQIRPPNNIAPGRDPNDNFLARIWPTRVTPYSTGRMNATCPHCGALRFETEKTKCCHSGKIVLPALGAYPPELQALMESHDATSNHFHTNIRKYNSSVAFASFVAGGLCPIQNGGPYSFRLHGQIYHRVGTLHPTEGAQRTYSQLYIIEGDQAVESRMNNTQNQGCRQDIMRLLTTVLERVNPFAAAYKHLFQVEQEQQMIAEQNGSPMPNVTMHIKRGHDKRRYNEPHHDEVAAVFVSSDGAPPQEPDVVIHPRDAPLTNLNYMSSNIDPMTYPLFFPNGEYGWQPNMRHSELSTGTRTSVTLLQHYAYRLAVRQQFSPIFWGGKLFQQYVVDAYLRVEANNLNFIKLNQRKLRVESYSGLMDHINNRADQAGQVPGKMVILPSSFQGSPRAMQQHYQDAMAIVCKYGKPDVFLTFTCNPKCPDIVNALPAGQKAADRPDIVARVFKLHLKELLKDIKVRNVLGNPVASIYVIEYQKRGLPHAHMLIIFSERSKLREPADIDSLISAEIPDPVTDPELHRVVTTTMLHGPCGILNKNSPCMEGDICTKDFPKDFQDTTVLAVNGYPLYRRRDNGRTVAVPGPNGMVDVDNRWVVPHNPYLSLKFQAHINLEACTSVKSVKYLFKYVYKGHDCASLEVNESNEYNHDEIKMFLDARYVSAPEAFWRLSEFKMHHQSHAIIRLALHLPDHHAVYFTADNAEQAAAAAATKHTTLTAFFQYNEQHGTDITYPSFPNTFIFKSGVWKPRKKRALIIGRVYSASPRDMERYCLRLLLHHVKGPTSFEDLRTVDGVTVDTFKEACVLYNLLEDDAEWDNAIQEAGFFQMPIQLRQLFVTICKFCVPSDPRALWHTHREAFTEDFLHRHAHITVDAAEQLALKHVESLLLPEYTCADLGLPLRNVDEGIVHACPAVDYDPVEEAHNAAQAIDMLNNEQMELVDKVLTELTEMRNGAADKCRAFFLDGPGGSGKTMCYNTIISWCRGNHFNVAPSAWTGIAATLLKGGRTCHNLFKLPVPILETSVCNITPSSKAAAQLQQIHLFIIDEASMVPANALRAIDDMMRDITQVDVPFGGRIFLLGGDFRQVLPVVPKQGRTVIVEHCLKRSPLWPLFTTVRLTQNMRAGADQQTFARWLLQLGNGDLTCESEHKNAIEIPTDCIISHDLVDSIFSDLRLNPRSAANTVILSPTNETALALNNKVLLKKVPGPVKEYLSADRAVCDTVEEAENYPMEFINSLTPSGMPPHRLILKTGAIIMLLRNININRGLCNGTRLIVRNMHAHTIDAEILTGSCQGERVLIPRIKISPSDTDLPFSLHRTQFPVRLSYCMTINKAQGQTFDKLGILLPQPVFSHGQLYVAFSRARCFENIHVSIEQTEFQGHHNRITITENVVYKEVL